MASRIDDSHHPFKRKKSEGPGPKKRPRVYQTDNWECTKRPSTKKHYIQKCVWVGKGKRKPVTVKTAKRKKKAYNKLYRKWRAGHPGPQKRVAGYHCGKRPNVKCK